MHQKGCWSYPIFYATFIPTCSIQRGSSICLIWYDCSIVGLTPPKYYQTKWKSTHANAFLSLLQSVHHYTVSLFGDAQDVRSYNAHMWRMITSGAAWLASAVSLLNICCPQSFLTGKWICVSFMSAYPRWLSGKMNVASLLSLVGGCCNSYPHLPQTHLPDAAEWNPIKGV